MSENLKEEPNEEAKETKKLSGQFELTILPLQNTTIFPQTVVPLAVGRERSVKAVEHSLTSEEKSIGCITVKTKDVKGSDATPSDMYEIGTVVNIKRMMRTEDVVQLVVQGIDRFKVVEWVQEEPFLKAKIEILPELLVVKRTRLKP